MDLTMFIKILFICDLYMVITQSAESGDDRNDPRNSRSEETYMRRKQGFAKDKRVRINQDEEMSERGRSVGESSAARRRRTGKDKMKHEPEGETSQSRRSTWTNEECDRLLRMASANYKGNDRRGAGAIEWRSVVINWHGQWDTQIRDILKLKFNKLKRKMQEAVKNFDNGGVEWSERFDNELLRIYFATEAGDKLKHAERIHDAWLKENPEYRVTPNYLLQRAEKLLNSVMKFSLDNPRGKIEPKQLVDWKPKHDRLLQFIWQEIPKNAWNRKQQLYDEAVKHCSAIKLLDEDRIYERARWLSLQPVESHKTFDFHGGSLPGTIHSSYHLFMDDRQFPSLDLGSHGHHVEMTSTNLQPGPSYSRPESDLDLNIFHSGKQSPDTDLYLGYQSHEKDND